MRETVLRSRRARQLLLEARAASPVCAPRRVPSAPVEVISLLSDDEEEESVPVPVPPVEVKAPVPVEVKAPVEVAVAVPVAVPVAVAVPVEVPVAVAVAVPVAVAVEVPVAHQRKRKAVVPLRPDYLPLETRRQAAHRKYLEGPVCVRLRSRQQPSGPTRQQPSGTSGPTRQQPAGPTRSVADNKRLKS
jgi:hypothetical protein